ncbi:oxidoreductase [Pigmentiphaga sp. NML080357]|uniref:SDR family NAD(P)-dependent oxidoreductase n=1 Tax=Pigmentiphaga sp. NML080357 TaxID=2008675 RepID=UPI000B418AC7|nr:SDR family oxidoreductase [Pigmentiphaga sp. NML080357]OVZ56655.1 oxidoreductase [Pigmentiphaga sp. NML080357]
MDQDLQGQVALVIGSTTSVGYRVAETLARRGASVALNGRGEDAGRRALERLGAGETQAIFQAGDATSHDDMVRVVDDVERRLGPIGILVCCGGSARPGPTPFLDLAPEQIMPALEGRLLPRLMPVRAAAPRMRERRGGSIVLMASDAGRFPTPGESLIGAAGAAIMLMTKTLAKEFSRWSIRVNCVALTLTADTERYEQIFSSPSFSNDLFTKALARFPAGRAPTASEVAEVAAFLASPRAGQVTGQTVSVNGGLSFGGW